MATAIARAAPLVAPPRRTGAVGGGAAAVTVVRVARWGGAGRQRGGARRLAATGPATPPEISEKVQESIEKAMETCAGDPVSGECIAAWDEVEELSAAASHAREKAKATDPLEEYCKDNPETDECRTYED
ncbi:unnamed protein product [Spirodela intermedia]|uniref:CP12 domain-containing protein n=2 Tax=Spirodela intermedia TaxID=51605 RepID=A0A7I8IXW7_SPIIN|nr:unnamed protein product [Spirodela intermedia]CAA6662002.1 unnamed protein product [Spirodela intermedia]CAA7398384.1 unnamed protein product [Spirodela intermedia]